MSHQLDVIALLNVTHLSEIFDSS